MKKYIKYLFIYLFLLTSCKTVVPQEKINYNFINSNYSLNKPILLNKDEIESKISLSKQTKNAINNFLLLIYSPNCNYCKKVLSYLNKLIEEKHFEVYLVNYLDYKNLYYEKNISVPKVTSFPTFIYFNKQDYLLNPFDYDYLKTYESFKNNFYTFFVKSNFISLNTVQNDYFSIIKEDDFSTLEDFINKQQKVIILYSWKSCLDCLELYSSFFIDFIYQTNIDCYYFETNYFISQDQNVWLNFTNKFSFNDYKNGKVPAFVYYEKGKKIDVTYFSNYGEPLYNKENNIYFYKTYSEKLNLINSSSKEELEKNVKKENIKLIKNFYLSKLS